MPTAVITGANSGIGHALARLLINEVSKGYDIYACDIQISDPIKSLEARIVELDVTSSESIAALKETVGSKPIDILFNVAGVLPSNEDDTLTTISPTTLLQTFQVNTFGPLFLTQALLPNLLASGHPRVYNVSSRVGSMGDNSSGGGYAYRSSKAALNAVSKSMAVDLKDKGVTVLILHPGMVNTNMLSVKEGGVEADVAARGLWEVCVGKGMEGSGRFWHRNGEELPW